MRHLSVVTLCAACLLACDDRTRFAAPNDAGPVCGDNEKLVNGVCRFVCQRDGDCPAGQACNLLTGECGPKGPEVDAGPVVVPCTTGAVRCSTDTHSVEQCGADGGWATTAQCPQPDGFCQNEQCLSCRPGLARCGAAPTQLQICKDDGSAFRDVTCTGAAVCVAAECAECASGQTRCSPDGHSVQECRHQANETISWTWANAGDNFDGTCITQQCTSGSSGPACVPPVCVPGAKQCLDAATQQTCTATGAWGSNTACTSLPGMTATAQCLGGACIDECADAIRASSYFGCEYWSAVLDNSMDSLFKGNTLSGQGSVDSDFVFVVTNQSVSPANVEVWRYVGSAPVRIKQVTVPGRNDAATKGLVKIPVPWQSIGANALNTGEGATGTARYGYHLTSNRPVTVYQFNPVDAVKFTKACTATAGSHDCGCDEYSGFDSFTCSLFGADQTQSGICTQTASGKKCGYGTFSNDASLLLPAHILGTSHVVVAPDHSHIIDASTTPSTLIKRSQEVVIVATQDNTTVTLKSTATTLAGTGITAVLPNTTRTFTLQSYGVLQFASDSTGVDYDCWSDGFGTSWCRKANDLTGSVITSDKPVAVFAGHPCQNIPTARAYCDHNEEQLFPFNTWGKNFVAVPTAPLRLNNGTLPMVSAAPDHFKIVAGCPSSLADGGVPPCPNGTLLTFSSPPAAANVLAPNNAAGASCLAGTSVMANNCRLPGGGFVEFKAGSPFTISADQPIAVAQFMPGQGTVTGAATDPQQGDPSMILLPPIEQWRSRYTVLASTGLKDNYLGLSVDTAKVASVQVDGVMINLTPGPLATDAKAVGSTTFVSKNHPVSTGTHTIQVNPKAGQAVLPGAGVTVYGYDAQVSYGYTGGLDLGSIVTGINPGG